MRRTITIIALLILHAVMAGPAAFAAAHEGTSAGVSIETQATMFYQSGMVSTEPIVTTVAQMYAITIEPVSSSQYGLHGTTYYFPHMLTNFGNGTDLITFTILTATPDTWSVSLVSDNGNLSHEAFETTQESNPVILSEDGEAGFFVAVTIPTGEANGVTGYFEVLATSEGSDGGYYTGANGTVYGGPDTAEVTEVLTVESIRQLKIFREDTTNKIYLTWVGANADVYKIDSTFEADFHDKTIEASNVASPYYCDSIMAKDGKIRYYKVALTGTNVFAPEIAGKYDVSVEVGINQLASPFVLDSTQMAAVVGRQVTGGRNEGAADEIWKYDVSASGGYNKAWLVGGVGDPYDGQWYTVSSPTTLVCGTDEGWNLEIKSGHNASYITLVGQIASTDRTIPVSVGMNYVGCCFPVTVTLEACNLWQSGMTGARNSASADQVWRFNEYAPGSYDVAWLVDNVNSSVNGKWYTVNSPTTIKLYPGRGYWLDVLSTHHAFTWNNKKPF